MTASRRRAIRASIFLGRLNRVYGVEGQPAPAGSYQGRYGFILE